MKAVNKLDSQLVTKTCHKRTEGQSVSPVGRKKVEVFTWWVIQEFIARGSGGIDFNGTTFKKTLYKLMDNVFGNGF